MRKVIAILALALSASAVCPVTVARADEPAAANPSSAKFVGSYAIVDATAAQAAVEAAIEAVVSEMSFIKRPFARSKLRDTNALLRTVRMQFDGDRLTYTYNGSHVIRTTVNGPAIRWKSPADGEFYQVRSTLNGQRLTLTFRGEGGAKQENFDLSADGQSIMYQATVTSPQLPKTLRFRYILKRT